MTEYDVMVLEIRRTQTEQVELARKIEKLKTAYNKNTQYINNLLEDIDDLDRMLCRAETGETA